MFTLPTSLPFPLPLLQSDQFDTAKSLLTGSFSRVKHMNQQTSQNCKIMCYFSLFAIVLFFLCYFLMGRVGRSSD